MAKINPDFNTKKACKEALAAGRVIEVFNCTPLGDKKIDNGSTVIEAPHHFHKWYGQAKVANGQLVSVK